MYCGGYLSEEVLGSVSAAGSGVGGVLPLGFVGQGVSEGAAADGGGDAVWERI